MLVIPSFMSFWVFSKALADVIFVLSEESLGIINQHDSIDDDSLNALPDGRIDAVRLQLILFALMV